MPVVDLSSCYVEIPEDSPTIDPQIQTRMLIQRLKRGEEVANPEIENLIAAIVGKHRAAVEAKAAGIRKPRTPKPVDPNAPAKPATRRTRAKATDTLDPNADF